jgi:hypothetical protein
MINRIKKLEKLLQEKDKKIIVIWDKEDENNYTDKQLKEAELIIRVQWGSEEDD